MSDGPPAPAAQHANNFQFLRFLLAALVLVAHAYEMLGYYHPFGAWFGVGNQLGAMAVNGFFLISGYLISASWIRRRSLGDYIGKRCWRIYPGFTVAFVLTLALTGPLAGFPAGPYWSKIPLRQNLFALLTLSIPSGPENFGSGLAGQLNLSMWTIRYEFACYLAVVGLGAAGLFARRGRLLALTILAIGIYLAQLSLLPPDLDAGRIFKHLGPVPRLLSFFLVGACYQLYPVRFTRLGCLLAAAVWAVGHSLGPVADQAASLIGGGYFVFGLAFLPSRFLRAWNRLPDVSYGLYLYGWPIQILLIRWFPAITPGALFGAALALGLAAGAASWYGVERQFLRTRRIPTPRQDPEREPLVTAPALILQS